MLRRQYSRLFLGAVFCTGLLPSCAARQPGPDEPRPGEPWIRNVELVGAHGVDEDDVLEGLASREPSGVLVKRRTRVDPALIERDRLRIETYYKSLGYFDAAVVNATIKRVDGERSDIVFAVDEGKRSRVVRVTVDDAPQDVDVTAFGLREGDAFDYALYEEDKSHLLAVLLSKGFAHARVEGTVQADRGKRQVVIRYAVDAGPRVRFGKTVVRGLKIIPESAVRNRLTFREGDVYSPRDILSSRSKVRSLGRFGVVRIDFVDQKQKGEVGDVAVTVTEAPRNEVRLGGGLGLDRDNFQVRGRAGYTRHGIYDPLLSFTGEVRPAYAIVRANTDQRQFVGEASGTLTREDLIFPLMRGTLKLGYDIDVLEAYSSRGGRGFLGITRPILDSRLFLAAGWRFEVLDFTRVDAEITDDLRAQLGLISPYRLGLFEQSIALDLRDSPLNARNGFYAQVRFEQGGSYAGGEFDYGRVTPEARAYYALSDRIGLAVRAMGGAALWGTIPITRRYYSGGSTTHRGFSQRRLSPVAGDRETSDIGIGGDKLVETVAEARVGIVKLGGQWLGLAFFGDGGDVVLDSESIDLGNLHWALGTGARYNTIVGPIRFDVAYRVTRAGIGEIQRGNRFAFHFSIGEAF